LYAKKLAQGKGLIIPDDARTNSVVMSAWIDTNRVKKRSKRNRKTSNRPVESAAPQAAPPKRSRRQKVDTDPALLASVPATSIGTPLRIPYGNKEIALKLGARYGSEGWYAPSGVDLSAFGDRGWLP
jgi:DNA topoisomerase III